MNQWQPLLDANPFLSDRYRSRYAVLLGQLEPGATRGQVDEAERLAVSHASRAVAELLGTRPVPPSQPTVWRVMREGSHVDVTVLDQDLDRAFAAMAEMEQTRVPVHPSRSAHVTPVGAVALRWPADSVDRRTCNAERFAAVAASASQRSPIQIEVWQDYAIYSADRPYVWTVAPNLGMTLEDLLRTDKVDRGAILGALRALRMTMLDCGLVWQGFAPRNMFFVDGRILLIDFEELVETSADPVRAVECLLWHRVFFADCLDVDEATALLGDEPLTVPKETLLAADAFERELLGETIVTFGQRRELLRASAALEGRHHRPDGTILFGHELGHFWGDFVAVAIETAVFRHLTAVDDPEGVTACMEVFGAAAEADIIRMMRQRAAGDTSAATPRTRDAADMLDVAGWRRLSDARRQIPDWYNVLRRDPAELLDRTLFRAGSTLDGPTTSCLIGDPSGRPAAEEALRRTVGVGLNFMYRRESVLRYVEPEDVRDLLSAPLPAQGNDFDAVLRAADTLVVAHSVSQSHPGYLAFPDSANSLAAVAGSVLGRLLNQNLITVDRSAPAATFVEIQVIEWLRELVGYDTKPLDQLRGVKDVGGLWTTGGHLSNHVAMLTALGRAFPAARQGGLRSLDTQPVAIMSGPIAHYSHSDAAFHLGLGWDSMLSVAATAVYTTDVGAVEKALSDPPRGTSPFMVIGVAGNCRTTGLDDLAALGEVCRRYGVWFHVDACHGGSLIFSDRLRNRHLAGIELADSISLDPHKGLFTPYPSSYMLVRERHALTQFSRHDSMVMRDDCWDLGLITPFLGSRGFESLATWMMLRHIGIQSLGKLVEARQALVRHLQRRIDASGLFVGLNDVDFYRLAFVFCPLAAWQVINRLHPERRGHVAKVVSEFTSRINTALYRSGEVCFDEHTLADIGNRVGAGSGVGYTVMAACPGNPLVTRTDIDAAVRRVEEVSRPLVGDLLAALRGTGFPDAPARLGGPAGWGDT